MKQMVFLRFDAAGFRVDHTAPHDPFIPVLDVIETVVAGGEAWRPEGGSPGMAASSVRLELFRVCPTC